MSSHNRSPRVAPGVQDMALYLRDLEHRLAMIEQKPPRRLTPRAATAVVPLGKHVTHLALAVTVVADDASRPTSPRPGDRTMALDSGTVYTADANGVWQVGGTIP